MIRVYLDDVRPCPEGFMLSRNVRHCLRILKDNKGNIEILSLDHDMGHDSNGFWLVRHMVNLGLYADYIFIHSANPIGREKMFLYLLDGIKHGMIPSHVRVYNHAM